MEILCENIFFECCLNKSEFLEYSLGYGTGQYNEFQIVQTTAAEQLSVSEGGQSSLEDPVTLSHFRRVKTNAAQAVIVCSLYFII